MTIEVRTVQLDHPAIKEVLKVHANHSGKGVRTRYPWHKLEHEGEAFVIIVEQHNKSTRKPNKHDRVALQRKLSAAAAYAGRAMECDFRVLGFDNAEVEPGGPMGIVVLRAEDWEPWRRLGSQL